MPLIDPASLAGIARLCLARPPYVSLHVEHLGDVGDHSGAVLLLDDDGRPIFTCEQNSPVAVAATRRCAAVLTVAPPPAAVRVNAVRIRGHLTPVGSERVDHRDHPVIGLDISSVLVELHDIETGTCVAHDLAVQDYLAAESGLGAP